MIIYDRLLKNKKSLWTRKHSLTLQFMLNKVFPSEIIEMIEYYVKDKYQYLYWFGFNTFDNNFCSDDVTSTINFSRIQSCKINLLLEKSDYTNTEIIFMTKNILNYKDGMGGLLYN